MSTVPRKNSASALPVTFPASMLLDVIQDNTVVALLAELDTLRHERNELRPKLREALDNRDKALRELKPKTEKFNNDLSESLDTLHRAKDELYTKLDHFRNVQNDISAAREEVRTLSFSAGSLRREAIDAEMLLRDAHRELERLQSTGTKAKIDEQKKRVERYQVIAKARSGELNAVEEQVKTCKLALDELTKGQTSEERTALFQKYRKEISDIQEKISAKKQQRSCRPENPQVDTYRALANEIQLQVQSIEARTEEIRSTSLPYRHFTYPPECRMELIGRGGSTLRQLQLDFGVAVCIDNVDAGEGFVVGGDGDTDACVAAISKIVSDAERNQQQEEVLPLPEIAKSIVIGSRGAAVTALERQTGTRIKVLDSTVSITGSAEGVRAAVERIESLINSVCTEELPFAPQRLRQILGKGGEIIREIERESGVRSLRVDRTRNVIVAKGSKDSIERAFKRYRTLLDEEDSLAINTAEGCMRFSEYRATVNARLMPFLTSKVVRSSAAAAAAASEGGDASSSSMADLITPLDAVRLTSKCDVVLPRFKDSSILLRGTPESVSKAKTLISRLTLHNKVCVLRLPLADVLRGHVLRRESKEEGCLLDQIGRRYSPILRINMSDDKQSVLVSSVDEAEARAAAKDLAETLAKLSRKHVRIVRDAPANRIGSLIGPRGVHIREIQDDTGTYISVLKESQQVHVYHAEGDEDALEEALHIIRVALFGEDYDIDDDAAEEVQEEIPSL